MTTQHGVDGFDRAYDHNGSGSTPIIMLHGWPGDRADFATVASLLDAETVLPDLRGFGGSQGPPEGDYSAVGQAAAPATCCPQRLRPHGRARHRPRGDRRLRHRQRGGPARCPRPSRARQQARRRTPLPGIGRRNLEPPSGAEFWYQSFHQLDLATDLIDGRPDAVRRYLRHFWSHWSDPGFVLAESHLGRLTEIYARPGAFASSIG